MWTQFWVNLCLHLGCPNKNKSVFVKVLVVLICILVAKSYIHTNLLLRQQWEQFAYRWDCTESAYFIAIPTITEFGKCPMSEKPSRPLHSDPQSCKCTGAGTEWCFVLVSMGLLRLPPVENVTSHVAYEYDNSILKYRMFFVLWN